MLIIRIVTGGRIKNRFVADGIDEYVKRIGPMARLEFIRTGPKRGRRRQGSVKSLRGGLCIALDPEGSQPTSEELAEMLRKVDSATFLIGEPEGLPEGMANACDLVVSLSRLTFTSEMAELILVEQIYRALTIIRSHPYHK